ncbi:hypothetical protein [Streptomyces sp. B1I3]|uniref:hypothetical protein n=1 Tax=Streptomyces sp. B1I3 TaxID=3042264 RepID=UPI0027840B09|nr:hypothetical protein [Streptomyces sp. B1I3]MDQ0798269.1 hypothetical protein [Streptomyces sp. B1I3]
MDDAAMALSSVADARPVGACGTAPWFGDARFLDVVSVEAHGEVVAGGKGVGVVGAEDAFEVGEDGFLKSDGFGGASGLSVGGDEVVAGGEGVRVVGAARAGDLARTRLLARRAASGPGLLAGVRASLTDPPRDNSCLSQARARKV